MIVKGLPGVLPWFPGTLTLLNVEVVFLGHSRACLHHWTVQVEHAHMHAHTRARTHTIARKQGCFVFLSSTFMPVLAINCMRVTWTFILLEVFFFHYLKFLESVEYLLVHLTCYDAIPGKSRPDKPKLLPCRCSKTTTQVVK